MSFNKFYQDFSQVHYFESLMDDDSFYCKKMFGSLSLYFNGKMVAVLSEDPNIKSWKKMKFNFEIWNGLLLPTEFEYHHSLQTEFIDLVQHPVLKKWLYLPLRSDSYETTASQICRLIRKHDERFGILPKTKKKNRLKK